MCAATRERPDIQIPLRFLSSRVAKPDEDVWNRIRRMLKFVSDTMDTALTLSAENMKIDQLCMDASYRVCDDYKSQTGATLSLGRVSIMTKSIKQKIKTKRTTECNIVGTSGQTAQLICSG